MIESIARLALRSLFLAGATMLAATCSGALAQQLSQPRSPLLELAKFLCSGGITEQVIVDLDAGYMPMIGLSEPIYSMRVLRNANREAMIPAEQCGAIGSAAQAPAVLILAHSFSNPVRLREGYYYSTTLSGELIKAVHVLEGRSNPFIFAPLLPVRRADFEGEKAIWLSTFVKHALAH